MQDTSRATRKVSWQTKGKRVTMLAEMAVRQRQVAQRLGELRDQHELTQEQAAQKVGITVRQWQRWEDGTSMPHARNLKLTADAFGVKVSDFFDEDEIERIKGGANGELRPNDLQELHRKLDEVLRQQEVILKILRLRRRTEKTRPTAPPKRPGQQAPPRSSREERPGQAT